MLPFTRSGPRSLSVAALICACAAPSAASEPVDLEMVTRIRQEGFHRSQVMETLTHLTETIGPRVTGSPAMKEANEWTRDRLASWGLSAELEPYDFGRGWSFTRAAVHMIEPHQVPLIALPQAWTPGTGGAVRGPAVVIDMEDEEDLVPYRGKVAGKIVFLRPEADDGHVWSEPERYSEADLTELVEFDIPDGTPSPRRERWKKALEQRRKLNRFLVEEKALALVQISSREHGVVRVTRGGPYRMGAEDVVPGLTMAVEHFQRVVRFLDDGQDVLLEIDVEAEFHDEDGRAYNTIAEIAGGKNRDEIVMLGAHLDSWHAGTGATDNAASCAAVMEAVRILKTLGVQPRRTIRVALWSGEEPGLLGSRAYVRGHFATRPETDDPEQLELPPGLRKKTWPITVTRDHAKVSAYFNLDNGGGRIRGIYAEENAAVRPVFEAWLEPFSDLGASTVTLEKTSGTDHVSFREVGLPGFQFIQDDRAYSTRTHHTNLDVLEAVDPADLKQAAVILASFAYHAAMRSDLLPRGPMPQPDPSPAKPEKPDEQDQDALATAGAN